MRRYLDARNRSKGARCVSGNAPPRAANQHSPPKANSLATGSSSIFLGSSIATAFVAGSQGSCDVGEIVCFNDHAQRCSNVYGAVNKCRRKLIEREVCFLNERMKGPKFR
jgi:hypothetical protein